MRQNSRTESAGGDLENNCEENNICHDVTKKGKRKLIKDRFVDYLANSNLHGLKYIGEKERSSVEKIFWFFMFTGCVIFCGILIRQVWTKWNQSPVIVSFAESATPVWQIPYPAVTVCYETKAMQTRFNFTEYYHVYLDETAYAKLTQEEKHLFEDVSMLCDVNLNPERGRKFSLGNETVANIKQLSANISELFFECKWRDTPNTVCEDLFSPILTEEGLCYTFNTMGAEELFRVENLHTDYEYMEHRNSTQTWTLDTGYLPSATLETYPHRGSGSGVKAGLHMVLKAKEIDLDYLCKTSVQGFKILLHNPAELPRLSQRYFRLPLSKEVVVAVKPKMMTTTDGLRPYNADVRQCYFPDERYLRYFKVYTQANCELECLTNFTYARCGCVHFGMPRGPNMTVCNVASMECVMTAQVELVTIQIRSGIETETDGTLGDARAVAAECKCLLSCTSLEYEAESSQADIDYKAFYRAFGITIDKDNYHLSSVMIYFKETQFITSRRSELYGPTDFLANCGGLLGLFMGFSILSVVEIIYFLTLRLCCSYARTTDSMKNEILSSKLKHSVK